MPLIRDDVPLAPLTYYKIGGPARHFAQPESAAELAELSDVLRARGLRYFVLGAGSNVLLDDAGFDGLVISTAKLDRRLSSNGPEIEAGASVMIIQLLRLCMQEGIGGFELLAGVPGNVGGALFMNAGTKLGEIAGTVQEITAYDLAKKTERVIPKAELRYSYRAQHFLRPDELVVRGRLRGQPGEPAAVQQAIQQLLDARKKSQPIDKPSCGSVFKNPDPARGLHAWKVIADAGLRGHKIGQAQISELHTNFIVNLGGATARDVRELIAEAKRRVKDKLGVTLEEEVRIVPVDGGRRLS